MAEQIPNRGLIPIPSSDLFALCKAIEVIGSISNTDDHYLRPLTLLRQEREGRTAGGTQVSYRGVAQQWGEADCRRAPLPESSVTPPAH